MSAPARGTVQSGQANHNRRLKAIEAEFVRATIPDGLTDPDSTTDNSAAIQASFAVTTGGILRFLAGTYRAAGLLLPTGGLHLDGAGMGKTIIKFNGASGGEFFSNPNQQGSSPLTTHTGTRVSGTSFTVPTNVTSTYRPGRQLYISGALTGVIYGLIETSVFGATTAISFSSTAAVPTINAGDATVTVSVAELPSSFTDGHYHFSNMTIDGNTLAARGLWLDGVESVTLENFEVKNTVTGHGVRIRYARRVDVDHFYGHDTVGNAIGISIADYVTISNSRVRDCDDHGIAINCVRRGYLDGVQSSDNDSSGISIESNGTGIGDAIADGRTERVTLSGCHGEHNGTRGLLIGNVVSRYIRVIGGSFSYNTTEGIGGDSTTAKGSTGEISIVGAEACYNGTHGISASTSSHIRRLIISNCHTLNNGQLSAAAGIFVPATTNADNMLIQGNHCYDTQSTPTQDYGIQAQSANINNSLIKDNDCSTYQTAPLLVTLDSDTCIVKDNLLGDNNPQHTVTGSTSTIDVTMGQNLIRLQGSGSVVSMLGAYIGQETTLVAKSTNWVLRNNSVLRLQGSVDFAMPQNAVSTFKMITDGEWYETSRSREFATALAISSVVGGGVQDAEARTAVNSIITLLQLQTV